MFNSTWSLIGEAIKKSPACRELVLNFQNSGSKWQVIPKIHSERNNLTSKNDKYVTTKTFFNQHTICSPRRLFQKGQTSPYPVDSPHDPLPNSHLFLQSFFSAVRASAKTSASEKDCFGVEKALFWFFLVLLLLLLLVLHVVISKVSV